MTDDEEVAWLTRESDFATRIHLDNKMGLSWKNKDMDEIRYD
jgi:hypothetical protein